MSLGMTDKEEQDVSAGRFTQTDLLFNHAYNPFCATKEPWKFRNATLHYRACAQNM